MEDFGNSDWKFLEDLEELSEKSSEKSFILSQNGTNSIENEYWEEHGRVVKLRLKFYEKCFDIPESIGLLTDLEHLEILGLSIEDLDEITNTMYKLGQIDYNEDGEEIGEIRGVSGFELPLSFGNLKSLKTLEINGIYLHELPESIENLQKLEKIKISNTFFESLPKSLSNLPNLEELEIKYNKEFKILPETFDSLKNIKKLIIFDNKI